ncbi:MAG TPA: DUF4367 domain-containing protein, partial [Terriglobales bacterium]|nr:DUF4367 domain-containing protein [Terriglobales bacterium]
KFAGELGNLAKTISPDPDFSRQLEARLIAAGQSKDGQTRSISKRAGNSGDRPRRNPISWAFPAIALSLVLLLVVVFLTVPSLNAVAKEALSYFLQVESDIKPTPTPIPGLGIEPEELPTVVKNVEREAEADRQDNLAGEAGSNFIVELPTQLPEGWEIGSVDYIRSRGFVSVFFTYERGGRVLTLYEQPAQELAGTIIGPEGEVESVAVGEATGEYVYGAWWKEHTIYKQATPEQAENLEWSADISQRTLRWQVGEMSYSLVAGGGSPGLQGFLGKEDLVKIAESLEPISAKNGVWRTPQAFSSDQGIEEQRPEKEPIVDIGEIEAQIGFDVLESTVLPKNYRFAGGYIIEMTNNVVLTFSCGENEWDFSLDEYPMTEEEFKENHYVLAPEVGPGAKIEKVMIGNVEGEYVQGTWVTVLKEENGKVELVKEVWHSELNHHTLIWYKDGVFYRISTSRGSTEPYNGPCLLDKDELIAFANGLK